MSLQPHILRRQQLISVPALARCKHIFPNVSEIALDVLTSLEAASNTVSLIQSQTGPGPVGSEGSLAAGGIHGGGDFKSMACVHGGLTILFRVDEGR